MSGVEQPPSTTNNALNQAMGQNWHPSPRRGEGWGYPKNAHQVAENVRYGSNPGLGTRLSERFESLLFRTMRFKSFNVQSMRQHPDLLERDQSPAIWSLKTWHNDSNTVRAAPDTPHLGGNLSCAGCNGFDVRESRRAKRPSSATCFHSLRGVHNTRPALSFMFEAAFCSKSRF